MTPQLQQAIRLLQLSSLELQTEIQEALETNPLLEVEEDFEVDENARKSNTEDQTSREISELDNQNIPEDLPVDSQWEDTYDYQPVSTSNSNVIHDGDMERENQDESTDSLQQHLLWQMRLTHFTEIEEAIATIIIDSIEDDGYLKTSLDDIQASLGEEFAEIELDEIGKFHIEDIEIEKRLTFLKKTTSLSKDSSLDSFNKLFSSTPEPIDTYLILGNFVFKFLITIKILS